MTTNTNAAPDNCTVLPDGSAFALASYPLPKDHWLYAPREYEPGAEEPKELPHPILTHAHRAEVVAAVRYAIRGATMCGKEEDFDPDALVQNAVYALCGPFEKTALSAAAQPPAGIWVPTELAERVQETMGEFLMDHGWRQQDMDASDEFGALLAVATKAVAAPAAVAEPVAWLHDDPQRYDVIHAEVKDLLVKFRDAAGYLHRPLDKAAHYTIPLYTAPAPAAQGDALPREEFAWMVVQEACETEPADEDDPECIRILRRDLKSAVLAAFLREDAARMAKEGGEA